MKRNLFLITVFLIQTFATQAAASWWPVLQQQASDPVVEVTSVNTNDIDITLNLSGFYINGNPASAGAGASLMFTDGVSEMLKGCPDLQHISVALRLAPTGSYRLEVVDSSFTEFPGFYVKAAAGDPSGLYTENSDYNAAADAFYPAVSAAAGSPYIWCDARGISLQLYPLHYNAYTHTLRVVHQLHLRLVWQAVSGINELLRYSGAPVLSSFAALAESHFINKAEHTFRYNPVAEEGDMLIICPSAFVESLQPFIEWKAQAGVRCSVADAENFTTAAVIQQYVADFYYNNGLTYLLLAGDAAQVPALQAETGASDNMYGYIAGNDHYPEVLVGRFPAETKEQLDVMVNRTIAYEKDAQGGSALGKMIGVASQLGPGDDNEYDFEHIRNITSLLTENTFSESVSLFDGSQGGADAPGNPSAQLLQNEINRGAGAIFYIGHGTVNAWYTTGFGAIEVSRLSNTTFPFVWSAGCNSGDFTTGTCLAERFLRAASGTTPAGAVAAMMSTAVQSWYPPMDAQDEMAYILAGKRSGVSTRTFGGISMNGCMKMNDKYGLGGFRVTDTWTIFGDPSVVVRAAEPKEISAHHSPVIGNDAREFVVKLPVSDALACITYHGKLLGAARAEEGAVTIPVSDIPASGMLTLTVTAYNYKAYTAEISITALPAEANSPFPADNSFKVSAYTSLSWQTEGGTDPAWYEVLITPANQPDWNKSAMVTPSNTLTLSGKLEYSTTYLWKVVSHNNAGTRESRIFTFTTINAPDEDFESRGFPRSNWTNNSINAWTIDGSTPFEGNFALRSGRIGDSDSSRLMYSCFTAACDFLSFRVKVSSESGADKLQLLIDGVNSGEWSGELNWTEVSMPVDPGTHTLEWIFSRNASGSAGSDAAWLDNIYLPEHDPAFVQILQTEVCPDALLPVQVSAGGYARLSWTSNGSGTFTDNTLAETTYQPSADEFAAGRFSLSVKMYANAWCTPVETTALFTMPVFPEMNVRDTILYQNESLVLDLPQTDDFTYTLLNDESAIGQIRLDAANLNEGDNSIAIKVSSKTGCEQVTTFKVTRINSERPANGDLVQVYPNPARNTINFSLDRTSGDQTMVRVFSLSGQLVLQQEAGNFNSNSLDVSSLSEGMYLVRIETGGQVQNAKFIKTL